MSDRGAYDSKLPCKNPSCKSQGRPHPNCHCYADGGQVAFCSSNRAHAPSCKFFRDGGPVSPPLYAGGGGVPLGPENGPPGSPIAVPEPQDDTQGALGLSGAHHGLLGLFRSVGHVKATDLEKHARLIDEAKAQRDWRKNPTPDALPRTAGHRLGDKLHEKDHEGAAEIIQGHPLFGQRAKGDLKLIAGRLATPMLDHETSPEGLRAAADYLHSTLRGRDKLRERVGHFFEKGAKAIPHDEDSVKELETHLSKLEENPEELLKIGGRLGHYLPDHATMLAVRAAGAVNYLSALKPQRQQLGPLDEPVPVPKTETARYERQLRIAQDPLLVLQHAKDGTIQPQDMATLTTIFPGLAKKIVSDVSEKLIEEKARGRKLSYRERQGLSALLGQPLDFTQTPAAARAIMAAQGPQQMANAAKKNKDKASAVELRAIEKTDALTETPLEARLIHRNSR